jgi:hypothetical protein
VFIWFNNSDNTFISLLWQNQKMESTLVCGTSDTLNYLVKNEKSLPKYLFKNDLSSIIWMKVVNVKAPRKTLSNKKVSNFSL